MINIDNSHENSDWIKYRGLDIPGAEITWSSLQSLMNIPKNGKDRLDAIRKLKNNHQWYGALPGSLRSLVDLEIKKLEKAGRTRPNA